MPIVSSNLRRYQKRPIPMVEKMAQSQLGGLTKAKMGVKHSSITSPLQSRIDLARSMGRNPDISAPPKQIGVSDMGQMGQMGQVPAQTTAPAEGNPDNLSVGQYITILTILPQGIKNQPIRIVFAPPALTDFASKAQQSGMIKTASLVSAASQGSDITTVEVETTAKAEMPTEEGQQPMGVDRGSLLRSKLAQAQRNPFVNVNQGELAELYDLDRSSIDNLLGGQNAS